ncbi:hypothetical protein BS17DRAFT_797508 [Gyrodon lividus]|nr:hypothetical protein BS17DRAFT_797508 [Gyrodon lividus]
MFWNASVLSTVSSDTEPTVVITFDSAKYIFNAGENTTRAFLQSRQNWKKTRALFLTSISTQRASGLPGLLMTFADAGQSQVHITGPSGLLHLMASMRKYTYRNNILVTPSEVPLTSASLDTEHPPVYKDNNVSVFALPVLPEAPHGSPLSAGNAGVTTTPTPVFPNDIASSLKRRREPSPDQPSKRLPNQSSTSLFPDTIPSATELLREVATKSDFDPSSLHGEMAQAWRQLVVQTMFPATQVASANTDQDGPGKRKGKRRAEIHEVKPREDTPLKSARASQAPCINKPLPPPERALIGSPNRSLKPTVAYAIMGPRIRGKFDAQKAVALGLPRGPLRARLSKGECVTVQVKDTNGNIIVREIQPEDCIGESVTPGVILVFDTPTLAHIPGLLLGFADSAPFARYLWKYAEGSKEHVVRAVFHLCGEDVLEDERYKSFMNGFGPEAQHIVASRRHLPNPITFTSATYSQLRLNQLDPDIFPVQKFSCNVEKAISDVCGLPASTTPMRTNLLINLHPPGPPAQNLDAERYDLFHPAVSSNSTLVLPEPTRTRFAEAQAAVQSHGAPEGIPGKDVMICPLGTGSAMPSKFRNVSATLIRIPNYGYILLDAGEGTWGQLARNFGEDPSLPSDVWQVLRELKCIFISHMHGDHHIGLAKILAMRQRLDPPADRPLYIVGNHQVFLYLREYAGLEELGLSRGSKNPVTPILVDVIHWANNSFPSNRLGHEASRDSILALRDLCVTLGLESLRSVDVSHRTTCHGVIIKHTDGWSIVYSGDTVPTQKLVQAGQNATLLIHEATMADDQVEMAAAKMHSTVGQAIDIGKRMNAQNILLTHFSARYPTMPPSVMTTHKPGDPTLALAFDHANIKIGDMWKLNVYMKAIEQSFVDLEDEANDDAVQVAEADIA